jgi:outer membrane protein OmpA-like peptidoglycan-associated protein
MSGRWTAWVLGGLLAAAPAVVAQDANNTSADGHGVKKEDVKTWTATVDDKEYEVRPATPSYTGDTGLFHVSSAYTLLKGKAAFSLFRDNLDRDPKDIDFSVHGLNAAYGVTSRLELFAQIGWHRNDTDAIFQAGYFNDLPRAGTQSTSPGWQTGFGDFRLGAKLGLLNDHEHDPIGLAVKGMVKLGTADEAKGLGTGATSLEGALIVSKALGDAADLHGTVGYQLNSDPDGFDIGNALKIGGGINIPACRIFQVQADLLYTKYNGGDFEQTNPLDLVVGPVFWIKPGFFLRPAMSWNLNFDDRGLDQSSKSWTGRQIAIGYHPGTICHPIVAPPPPPPPPTNKQPTVSCEAEKSNVRPGESVRCRAVASDPDGDALTYDWTASAGKITGSGNSATWDSTGVPAGSVTITVRVSDGKGGTATSTCTVRVETQTTAKAITCIASGFPPNRDRLNNVDKACLDDVASRLRQDPRSRVVIIGHADSKEKYPEVIGRKRAEAAKSYLVKERGVDEGRISVRSEAARKPADTGTTEASRKQNRRVEIVFLPEGAELP